MTGLTRIDKQLQNRRHRYIRQTRRRVHTTTLDESLQNLAALGGRQFVHALNNARPL